MWSAILVGPLEEAPPSSLDFSCGFNCTCFHLLCGVWAIFSPNCLGPGFRLTVLFFFTFFSFLPFNLPACLPAYYHLSFLWLIFPFFLSSVLIVIEHLGLRRTEKGRKKKKRRV